MIKDGTYRKFFCFKLYEYMALETFLSDMALEGWMVESMVKRIGGAVFTFHEIEPQKINFAVEIYDKAPTNATERSEKTLEYIEYCQEAGWNLVCSLGKIQIFYSKNESSLPIHTDEKLKLKVINKGMIRWFLFTLLCISLIINPFYGFSVFDNNVFYVLILDNFSIFYFLLMNGIFIFPLANILDYIIWFLFALKKNKLGKDNTSNSQHNKRSPHIFRTSWIVAQILIFAVSFTYSTLNNFIPINFVFTIGFISLIMIIIYVYILFFRNKTQLRSTQIRFRIGGAMLAYYFFIIFIFIFIICAPFFKKSSVEKIPVTDESSSFTNDKVPISLEDLAPELQNKFYSSNSNAELNESIMAQNYEYTYDHHDISIRYSVFSSPYQWILDKCLQNKLNHPYNTSYKEVDPASWGANSSYLIQSVYGEFIIIVYDNKILQFQSDITLNDDRIKLIRDKLDLYN